MQKTILALFLTGVSSMQAGWITWTQATPVTQVQGTFTGGTGAYAGTVTATVSGGCIKDCVNGHRMVKPRRPDGNQPETA